MRPTDATIVDEVSAVSHGTRDGAASVADMVRLVRNK